MRVLAIILALCFAGSAFAQDDDRGYLQALIEDNLSGAGREVRIVGFSGALSSRATVEELTIADDAGIWLSLSGVTLDWSRSALLTGALAINALTAENVDLTRLPNPPPGVEVKDSQATGFKLPELPVSVDIGQINITTLRIGSAVLGQEATLTLDGRMALSGGKGDARLKIIRTDKNDAFSLEGSYDNESRFLSLDAQFNEAESGLISGVLKLPGRPALELSIDGSGPIDDFTARLSLLSNDELRLSGDVSLKGKQGDVAAFAANLSGNIAPLFQPEFQPFFGAESGLRVAGVRQADGALAFSELSLNAAALRLKGALSLDYRGWPVGFDFKGDVGGGGAVILPVTGPETQIAKAEFEASYDADKAENWRARVSFDEFTRDGLKIARGQLFGHGQIHQQAPRKLAALANFDLSGITHAKPDQARLLGSGLAGRVDLIWQHDAPLTINDVELRADEAILRGAGTAGSLAEGIPVNGSLHLTTPDLSRFAALTGQALSGRASALIKGDANLLGGGFDIDLQANTNPLGTGTPQLDNLLAGPTSLALRAARDTKGTTLQKLTLHNDLLQSTLSGTLNEDHGALSIQADLSEVSKVEPRLSGPAMLRADATWQNGQDVVLHNFALGLGGAQISGIASLTPDDPKLPGKVALTATIPALSDFAKLAKRPLSGALTLQAEGEGQLKGDVFSASLDATGNNMQTGLPEVDRLIAGSAVLHFSGGLDGEAITIRSARLSTPQIKADVTGNEAGDTLELSAALSDLALFAPGFGGGARVQGAARINAPDFSKLALDLTAQGPGGTTADITGTVNDFGQALRLALTGAVPLGLINRFITPRSLQGTARYDLRIDGKPALSSLSGTITTQGTRVALPNINAALDDVTGRVALANQRAEIELHGQYRDGGRITVTGPVGLVAPYPGKLSVTLAALHLSDRQIYETTANGALSLDGPLTGGALIGGTITLEETNLQIPSGTGAHSASLPGLRHVAEPAAVHTTRARAGLIQKPGSAGPSRAFPLNLTIRASNRIFVRGRGLDAELGGRLKLTGTTADVRPSGVVKLLRGRLDVLGKRLELTEGLVDLRGALDPYMRFVAETTSDDTTVQIIVEGLASDPEITFQSQPELPQEEIVARLLFGRGLETISPFQAAQLASAVATLTGRNENDLMGKVRDSIGLSDIDVTSTEDGGTEVSAGAYISDNIYSEVTADSEGKREINLNLDVSRSLTVKGRVNNIGDTGVGLFYEKDY